MVLEEGNRGPDIGMNLLQLLGIHRQAGSQGLGAKALGAREGPTLLSVTLHPVTQMWDWYQPGNGVWWGKCFIPVTKHFPEDGVVRLIRAEGGS